jgi:uncharacterized sulfatase
MRRATKNLRGLAAGLLAFSLRAAAVERPNILVILTDDQGWPTLGCYGGARVPTPNLDRLAAEGVRFTDAYVMPQCTPTRAALLTGQHTARSRMWHVLPWYGVPYAPVIEPAFCENLPRDSFTVAKGLRAAGYATGTAGKWHLTSNQDGHYVCLKAEAAAHYGFDFSAPPGPGNQNEGDKHVDYLTGQALAFIQRNRERPWFFYLAHHTVHAKVSAPAPLVAQWRARGAPDQGMYSAVYLAALEHLDASVGRLLGGLDELGLRDRTLVLFMSDNGGISQAYSPRPADAGSGAACQLQVEREEFSNAPLRAGKGSPYEGGIRVPCLARWPQGARPGTVCETPVHVTDWAPTLLELAGAAAPQGQPLDGVSLAPLLRGGSLPARPLFWHLPLYDLRWGATPCAVVRDGDWKLIDFFGDSFDAGGRYRPGARVELYNLRADVGEAADLSGQEPGRARAMQSRLRQWLDSLGAPVPGPNPQHDPARPFQELRQKPPRRFFSADSFWNQPVPTNAAVDPRTPRWVRLLESEPSGENFVMNSKQWTIPVYEVGPETPLAHVGPLPISPAEKVRWHTARETFGHGAGFGLVPIPPQAQPDPKFDAHLALVDWSRGLVWDMWAVSRGPDGAWRSATGMVYPAYGTGVFSTESIGVKAGESVHFYGPSRASGVPAVAGLILYEEVAAGEIRHKLAGASRFCAFQEYVFPAAWTDGFTEGGIPQGTVIQLDPGLDLSAFPLTREERIVGVALQRYGLVLVDIAQGQTICAEGLWGHPGKSWEGKLPHGSGGLAKIPYRHYRMLESGLVMRGGDSRSKFAPVWEQP